MAGTNIYYLSGIKKDEIWWGSNPDFRNETKFYLVSKIDLLLELSNITTDANKLAEIYNELDKYSLLLFGLEIYAGDDKEVFERVCEVVGYIGGEDNFERKNISLGVRADQLETMKRDFESLFINPIPLNNSPSALADELKQELMPFYNQPNIGALCPADVCLSHQFREYEEPETIEMMKARQSTQEQIYAGIKKNGFLFLYRYLNREELAKAKPIVKERLAKQNDIFNYFHHEAKLNEHTQSNLIQAGIIKETGYTPEQLLRIMKYNKNGVQIGWLAVVVNVVSLIGGLLTLIKAVISLFRKSRPAPTEQDINTAIAQSSDLFSSDETGTTNNTTTTTNSGTSITPKKKNNSLTASIPMLMAGAMILFALKKK